MLVVGFLTETTNPLSRETRDVHQFVFHLVYCCFGFGFGWLLIGVMIVHKDRHICNTTLLISFLSETLSNDNVPNWCFHVVLSRDAVPLSTPSVVVVLGRLVRYVTKQSLSHAQHHHQGPSVILIKSVTIFVCVCDNITTPNPKQYNYTQIDTNIFLIIRFHLLGTDSLFFTCIEIFCSSGWYYIFYIHCWCT